MSGDKSASYRKREPGQRATAATPNAVQRIPFGQVIPSRASLPKDQKAQPREAGKSQIVKAYQMMK